MKHIRLFEGYLDGCYHQIDEYTKGEEIHNGLIPMEETYFLKLKKWGFSPIYFDYSFLSLMNKKEKKKNIFYMEKKIFRGIGDKVKYNILSVATFGSYDPGPPFRELFIKQIKDEYFILETREIKENKWSYYKCDQFEGLIQLLKDKGWYDN